MGEPALKNTFTLRPIAAALVGFGKRATAPATKPAPCAASHAMTRRRLLPLGAALAGMALSPALALAAEAADEAKNSGEVTLPSVNVRDLREQDNNGYQPGITNTTKLPLLSRDIPASLTTVPAQLMYDRGADTFKDALRNVAGLTFQAGEGGRIGDNIRLRGYSVVNDLYSDGIRDTAQYNRDLFNIEQIDVLRGSASMLFGRGTTGGIINQVSKQPYLYDGYKAAYTVGSDNYNRITGDFNKKIGDNAAIRVNVMKTDADSFRDEVHTNRSGFAPSIRWGIGTQDEFSLSYYYLKYHDTPDFGIPISGFLQAPVPAPVNRFYGLAAVDYQKDSAAATTAEWIHRFSADTRLKTILRYGDYQRDLRATAPNIGAATVFTDSTAVTRGRQARGGDDGAVTLQSDFTTRVDFGGFKHLLLAGIEYQRENSYRWNYDATGNANPATTLLPNPYPVLPATFFNNWQKRTGMVYFKDSTVGLYAQNMIDVTKNWKVLLGARYDDFRASYFTQTGAFDRIDHEWSYRSGLIYQPDDMQSYYVAYGTSFNPSAESYAIANTAAANTAPEKNRNIEAGGKWELFDGNLSLRSAVFRTEKTNERNTDALNPNTLLLSGRRHTDGIELEAAGRVNSRWEVFGAVARMWSRIDEIINPAYVGLDAQNTPPYTANLWTTYRLPHGWKLGAGAELLGERTVYAFGNISQNSAPPSLRYIPAYVRWDAMLAYEQKHYDIRLNVANLLDRTYYDAPYENGGFVVPGAPRNFRLTLALKY